jgi:hypothetical protein
MKKIKPVKYEGMGVEVAEEHYPSFRIDLEHLPEAKQWEIGKTYNVLLELKQKSIEVSKYDGKEMGSAGFDITGIEVQKKKADYKELPDM